MHRTDDETALLALGIEFAAPQLEHLRRWLDAIADHRVGQEGVLFPVVERPVGWQLGQPMFAQPQHVGPVIVHQRRVIGQTVLGE